MTPISNFLERIAGIKLERRREKRLAIIDSALKRAQREHDLAISALGRSLRSGAGTATAEKHRADYERHDEMHNLIISMLRDALGKGE